MLRHIADVQTMLLQQACVYLGLEQMHRHMSMRVAACFG